MYLVWLRNDLRIEDNPALHYAAHKSPVHCIYITTPQQWQEHGDSPAKIAFWRDQLIQLGDELHQLNIPLKVLHAGDYHHVPKQLLDFARSTNSQTLFFNREYPLNEKCRDQQVTAIFEKNGLGVESFHGDLVMPPGSVLTQEGNAYKVFTPFARQWHKQVTEHHLQVLAKPKKQAHLSIPLVEVATQWPETSDHANPHYRNDLWPTDSAHTHKKLFNFSHHQAQDYKERRDFPSINGTSTLSPYLAIGAISIRQCIANIRQSTSEWRENQWTTELIWREFYRHLMDQFRHLSYSKDFKTTVKPIPWANNQAHFEAWCQGETGYPIVDAAMKQLQQTGWMHNRLRMVVAAFLTKLLLIDWRKGEMFFMQHLLDGDFSSNNGGWQWAASTGADAAPYFRIFNPERQSERFDKEGLFIKKFLPELVSLDRKSIHNPSTEQRQQCGYPTPIIDYKFARQRALDSYASAMGKATS